MVYCEHCDEDVGRSTYYRHKRLTNDRNRGNTWSSRSNQLHKDAYKENEHTQENLFETENYKESQLRCSTSTQENTEVNHDFENDYGHYEESSGSYEQDYDESLDSDGTSDDNNTDAHKQIQDDSPEVWEDVSKDQIMLDLDCDMNPCPEPESNESTVVKVTNLLKWFVYFMLLWQSFCKVSDNGLDWLLQFNGQFFKVLANISGNVFLKQVAIGFPTSIYLLRKLAGLDRDTFRKYAVCTNCSKLYDLQDCTENNRYGIRVIKYCQNKKFPKSRNVCGAPLSKRVILDGNKEEFYPLKIYCFNGIINKLEEMLCRQDFPKDCEKWRELKRKEGYMSDVVDGKIWDEFSSERKGFFLRSPRNYMFMLNFDFFQPLKHRNDYSVGVLYLANLNLPRNIRFKWENIIVAGIIPDLEDGKVDLNEFLHPLVDDLKALWSGLYLKTSISRAPLKCRAALVCIACDIPAARKLCGFKSHNSNYGCSKCFKLFPGNVKDSFDYSGFVRDNWPNRELEKHRKYAKVLKRAKNKTEYQRLSMKYGMYYSALIELEYFDVIRFTIVDPMHNLFLGTGKLMFKTWVDSGLLSSSDIRIIEQRIKNFDVGTGLGRLPHNISSNYGCYTAAQWKNWTLVYSLYVLNGILPEQHMQCWQAFVLACKFLTRPVISKLDLEKADIMLIQFCQKFERLYGKHRVTPNMHLHGHLKECVIDYGPIYNFWCFSFERYNGIVSSFTINNRSIEVQLMRKIVSDRYLSCVSFPSDFEDDFLPTFKRKTVDVIDYVELGIDVTHASTAANIHEVDWQKLDENIILPKVHKVITLDDDDITSLSSVYKALYNVDVIAQHLSQTVRVYGHVMLANERFGSKKEARHAKSARVIASWSSNGGEICSTSCDRPGIINHYIKHVVQIGGSWKEHIFAVVDWCKDSTQKCLYGKPVEVWESLFVDGGASRFIPLPRIKSKFVIASLTNHQMVIVPLNRTFSF